MLVCHKILLSAKLQQKNGMKILRKSKTPIFGRVSSGQEFRFRLILSTVNVT